jgi:carbamoyltransferase
MVKRDVTILGLNDMHDAGAALVQNGRVLAAVQEERLRNIKHYGGIPTLSMKQVFEISEVHPSEVDAIALATLCGGLRPMNEEALSERILTRISPVFASHALSRFYVGVFRHFRNLKSLLVALRGLGLENKEIFVIEHHLAHAACAYRTAPYGKAEKVLIFTADGTGDGVSSTVSLGEKGEISRIAWSTFYDSLGNAFYAEITAFLGLKRWDHEYKVMGLAPYGRHDQCLDSMKKIIVTNPKNPLEFKNVANAGGTGMQRRLRKLLAGQRFDNVAAAAQYWLETLMLRWIEKAVELTDVHRITCAGGVFLNVKANKLIKESLDLVDAFFYPAAGDDGLPVGAALQCYHDFCRREGIQAERVPLADLYFGPKFDEDYVREALRKEGLLSSAESHSDIEGVIGDLLSKGKIVARFNGRLEWGPRALGNRSILADARDLKVVRKTNFAIKHRDFWMPFAPSILEERASDYLINSYRSPYMIQAFDTTDKRDEIIAAIHPFDLTARPQTVDDSWNASYRRILEAFQESTGVGGFLNTSFNLHGYPIVATPQQAIYTFKNSGLDGLAIGNYLVKK